MTNLFEFAPKIFRSTFSTTDVDVENGNPIRIWGIYINVQSFSVAGTFSIKNADGDILITARFAENRPFILGIPFTADKGLSFIQNSGTATLQATVFHSQAGS